WASQGYSSNARNWTRLRRKRRTCCTRLAIHSREGRGSATCGDMDYDRDSLPAVLVGGVTIVLVRAAICEQKPSCSVHLPVQLAARCTVPHFISRRAILLSESRNGRQRKR